MNTQPKHALKTAVVIWSKKGDGIYDGNTVYTVAVEERATGIWYGCTDAPNGNGGVRGWMPEKNLLSVREWQQKLANGEVAKVWTGEFKHFAKKGGN